METGKTARLNRDVSIMFNGGGRAADGYPVTAKKGDRVAVIRNGMGFNSFALKTGKVDPGVASLYKHDSTYYYVWVPADCVEFV